MEEATHNLIHVPCKFLSSCCPCPTRTCFFCSTAIPIYSDSTAESATSAAV